MKPTSIIFTTKKTVLFFPTEWMQRGANLGHGFELTAKVAYSTPHGDTTIEPGAIRGFTILWSGAFAGRLVKIRT